MKFAYGIGLACGVMLIASAAQSEGVKPLYRHVDPRVGVGNDNQGDTVIGPAAPHGSIHPSPQTLTGSNAGYDPAAPLSGFAQLHTQGSGGRTTYGTFLLSPQVGAPQFDEALHLSPKADEQAAADRYAVTLARYKTRVEVTAAHYADIYRVSYPDTDQAQLVFDVTRKILGATASDSAEIRLYPQEGKIVGRVRAKGYWSPALVDIWFCAKIDRKPTAWGVFKDGAALAGETAGQAGPDQRLGVWWSFGAQAAQPVLVKMAVSFTSAQKAEALLDHDIPGWNFEGVRKDLQGAWNKELGRVELSGLGDPDLTRFYTALYHTAIQPRDRSLDQADADLGSPHWDDYYTLWDTYRTEFPLMSLLKPREYASNVASVVHTFDRFGAADTAFIAGRNYHVGQGGDEVDNIIGEGLIRGVPGVDWNAAYRVTHFNAFSRRSARYLKDGYFADGDASPEPDHPRAKSGSSTLAFSLNDDYAAKVAEKTGHGDEAALLRRRAASWRNVWNDQARSDGYSGFILPRNADGAFLAVDPKQGWDGKTYDNVGFYEGTAWIYSYDMLHDIPGMIDAMGGPATFTKRLQHALSSGLIDITNEPSFSTPWLFSEVGRPDLTSYWADQIFRKFTADAYPGDEDNGAMSSHYVFNRLGLFPKLGSDLFYLHGPRQPLSVLHLENGKRFEIVGRETGRGNIYVQKAYLNGVALTAPTIRQSDITAGGRLVVQMGPRPPRRGAVKD